MSGAKISSVATSSSLMYLTSSRHAALVVHCWLRGHPRMLDVSSCWRVRTSLSTATDDGRLRVSFQMNRSHCRNSSLAS